MGFMLKNNNNNKMRETNERKQNKTLIIHMNKETCAENQKKLVFELRHLSVFFWRRIVKKRNNYVKCEHG